MKIMATYLKDFEKMTKSGVTYIPIGILEWHGNHLPIETDFLVAVKLCEILAKKKPGYVLPPIYLGTDKYKVIKNQKLIGMDRHLGKKLPGSMYFLEPAHFEKTILSLVKSVKSQGLKKIYIVTGHAGSGHIKALERMAKKESGIRVINPFENLPDEIRHADENETSLFWACYPDQEKTIRKIKIPATDDCFRLYGYDPRKKASLSLGKKLLKGIAADCLKKIE